MHRSLKRGLNRTRSLLRTYPHLFSSWGNSVLHFDIQLHSFAKTVLSVEQGMYFKFILKLYHIFPLKQSRQNSSASASSQTLFNFYLWKTLTFVWNVLRLEARYGACTNSKYFIAGDTAEAIIVETLDKDPCYADSTHRSRQEALP